ncbi:MAG: TSUP family transporter [Phycisphaera sp.]|nr:TSUP family transporter [Phycisphaera sp.]
MDLASIPDLTIIAAIGLLGGMLGGVLGLGGSLLIIPALTLAFGPNQHLYQAAALIVNVLVAITATLRHRGRGTIRRDTAPMLAVTAGLAAVGGVLASNLFDAKRLMALFGIFLLCCALSEVVGLARRKGSTESDGSDARVAKPRTGAIGLIGGFASGLLGIGGGAIMVPLLRGWTRLPTRQAVACSAAAMILACMVGAIAKNATVGNLRSPAGEALSLQQSLTLAALLAPTATAGASLGAALVYRLPVRTIRALLAALLIVAGTRMVIGGFAA